MFPHLGGLFAIIFLPVAFLWVWKLFIYMIHGQVKLLH